MLVIVKHLYNASWVCAFCNFVLVIWKHLLQNFSMYPFITKSGLLLKKSVVGFRVPCGFDVYFVILFLMVIVTYLFVAMSSLLATYALVCQVNMGSCILSL